jgi:hypothetical protein
MLRLLYPRQIIFVSHLFHHAEVFRMSDLIDIILKDRMDFRNRIKRALRVLQSWPTPEDQETEGFCMTHFYSQMVCAAQDLLEGNE